jgi:hypothetical protein
MEQGEAHASYTPTRVQRRSGNAERGAMRYQNALSTGARSLRGRTEAQGDWSTVGSQRTHHQSLVDAREGTGNTASSQKAESIGSFCSVPSASLHQELSDRGYTGSTRTVYKFLQGLHTSPLPRLKRAPLLSSPLDGVTPRHVVRWLLQPPGERERRTREVLALISQASHEMV